MWKLLTYFCEVFVFERSNLEFWFWLAILYIFCLGFHVSWNELQSDFQKVFVYFK
jgi:hypothetical protein